MTPTNLEQQQQQTSQSCQNSLSNDSSQGAQQCAPEYSISNDNENTMDLVEENSNTASANIALIKKEWGSMGDGNINKLAYIMATVDHESSFFCGKEKRQTNPKNDEQRKIKARQDVYWPTGFYGRGFVQLTWEDNYKKMSDVVGLDLVANPDLALIPSVAAKITVYGMINGSFTGKNLDDYIKKDSKDFRNARRIINGMDKASSIAKLANDHLERLGGSDGGEEYYSTHVNNHDLQRVLVAEGLLANEEGAIDGLLGNKSKEAIKAFKQKYDLPNPTSPKYDEATRDKVFEIQSRTMPISE